MREAFYYMFRDNKFWQKAGLIFIFIVCYEMVKYFNKTTQVELVQSIANIFFTLMLGAIVLGYSVSCVKALREQDKNYILPFMCLGKNFILGLKAEFAMFFTPLLLLFLVSLGCYSVIYYFDKLVYQSVFVVLLIAFVCLTIFYILLYPAFVLTFAEKESLISAFRFKSALNYVCCNKARFFKYTFILTLVFITELGISWGLISLFGNMGNSTLSKVLIKNLIITLLNIYALYVSAYLIAKSSCKENKEECAKPKWLTAQRKRNILVGILLVILSCVACNLIFNRPSPNAYSKNKGYKLNLVIESKKNLYINSCIKGNKYRTKWYDNNNVQFNEVIYDGGQYSWSSKNGTYYEVERIFRNFQTLNMGVNDLILWNRPANTPKILNKVVALNKNDKINDFDCDWFEIRDFTNYYQFGKACVNKDLGIAVAYKPYRAKFITKLISIEEVDIDDSEFLLPERKD